MNQGFEVRYRWNERPSCAAAGVYAYFVNEGGELSSVSVPTDGLLYIGMTMSSLDARCHFDHSHSGFSTFRRSLGAILKDHLSLMAVPRAPGRSRTNLVNYRFDPAGEARLTAWMRQHLTYGFRIVTDNVKAVEKDEIWGRCPPLNLTGWDNRDRIKIKQLRARCAAEASLSQRAAGGLQVEENKTTVAANSGAVRVQAASQT